MNKWDTLTPVLLQSIGETVYMVAVSLLISGVAGLAIGALLYATRPGNLFANRVVFAVANLVINLIRPIPFIIFLTAVAPVTRAVTGTTLGTDAAIVPITIMATVVTARVVEQNLVAVARDTDDLLRLLDTPAGDAPRRPISHAASAPLLGRIASFLDDEVVRRGLGGPPRAH